MHTLISSNEISHLIIMLTMTMAPVVLLYVIFKYFKMQNGRYIVRPALLTDAELNFYRYLRVAVPVGYILCPKVRVADVLSTKLVLTKYNRKEFYRNFSKISQKHFDFVICRENDFSFCCAIELNDNSHSRVERVERDNFLRSVCLKSKFLLLEVKASNKYSVDNLKCEIARGIARSNTDK